MPHGHAQARTWSGLVRGRGAAQRRSRRPSGRRGALVTHSRSAHDACHGLGPAASPGTRVAHGPPREPRPTRCRPCTRPRPLGTHDRRLRLATSKGPRDVTRSPSRALMATESPGDRSRVRQREREQMSQRQWFWGKASASTLLRPHSPRAVNGTECVITRRGTGGSLGGGGGGDTTGTALGPVPAPELPGESPGPAGRGSG